MSNIDTFHDMEELVGKQHGTRGSIILKVFAGYSSSEDGDSGRSNGTDLYVPVVGCCSYNRRKRKMLQPKRAAMYGSEVTGVWHDSAAKNECYGAVEQRLDSNFTPLNTLRPVTAAQNPVPGPAASKRRKPSGSTAAKHSRKSCAPLCGPCGNCGTTTSPQWRHGNDQKPIVCNACGIRYLRTGSFQKAQQSEKKRSASGGSDAVSGGARHAKRFKTDSPPASSSISSSSRQQLFEGEEPLDKGVDEVEPANCYPNKRPYNPNDSNVQLAAAADEDMELVDENVKEKSQDDLEAAECLQALATSASRVHNSAQHSPAMHMPSNTLSLDNLSSIMAVAAKAVSGNLSPWTANNSAGAGSNSTAINPMLMATLQAVFQGAAGGQGFDACGGVSSAASAAVVSFMQPPLQVQQLPHQHHVVTAGMSRPDGFTAGWGAAPKMSPASGGITGSARARKKQSSFTTEIEEKIPPAVQQACAQEWAAQEFMPVMCADFMGTFYVNSAGEYMIELANGEVVTPNKFEELAGKKSARNWQQSIRIVGYPMNGEESSALLKLGHFTRIVGLQDR